MTMTDVLPLTDDRGRALVGSHVEVEPNPGSVVLTNGEHGTAWQRYFGDSRWHRVGGGRSRDWTEMLAERNLVLVYDARERFNKGDL